MKLLIIEDDPKMINFLQKAFKKDLYAVDVAREGETGSNLARINSYLAVIIDYHLPLLNGYEVIREIRSENPNVIIIGISAQNCLEEKINCLEAGADDYLIKPFSYSEIAARIKVINRRKAIVHTTSIIEYSDIVMNLDSFEVTRQNEIVPLVNKEFTLLKFFMNQPKKVFSREIIMENVWDMNADPFSNTIETHIMRLRRKLEKHGPRVIHTVNSHGYKLD
jgi:DNA-binding response OmpR family regulator